MFAPSRKQLLIYQRIDSARFVVCTFANISQIGPSGVDHSFFYTQLSREDYAANIRLYGCLIHTRTEFIISLKRSQYERVVSTIIMSIIIKQNFSRSAHARFILIMMSACCATIISAQSNPAQQPSSGQQPAAATVNNINGGTMFPLVRKHQL